MATFTNETKSTSSYTNASKSSSSFSNTSKSSTSFSFASFSTTSFTNTLRSGSQTVGSLTFDQVGDLSFNDVFSDNTPVGTSTFDTVIFIGSTWTDQTKN